MDELRKRAAALRKETLRASLGPGHHLGGALSCIEVLTALYFSVLVGNIAPHFVMSKGHALVPLLLAIESSGTVASPIRNVRRPDLIGHPNHVQMPGVEVSTGSLGQGLSIGVGIAFGEHLAASGRGCIVLVGDGEMQEGQSWEAIAFAGVHCLKNLCVIVDANGAQADGNVPALLQQALPKQLEALGFEVIDCDGHDFSHLIPAITTLGLSRPRAIIANTLKGKGVSFMEQAPEWFTGTLDAISLERALSELEGVEA